MELGIYLEIDFLAQLGKGALSYEKTLYEHYWPLLTFGDRYYVYDFDYELNDGNDDIYLKGASVTYQVPSSAFNMRRMDLKTGRISETVYSPADFSYYVKDDQYHAFSATNGVITVTRPPRSDMAGARLVVTLKGRPLSFTSAPISRTFNLVWDDLADSYVITLNSMDGKHVGNMSLAYGSPISLPTPVRSGYSLAGWYSDATLTVPFAASTMPATNLWLYAKWTTNRSVRYTVRRYLQSLDGSRYDLVATELYSAETGSSVTPPVGNYVGFASPDHETVTVAGDESTVVEYYYVRNSYTATFETPEGGANVTLKYGAPLVPPSVAKPGFTFSGWNRAIPSTMPAANKSYIPMWSRIEYGIICDLVGGSAPGNPVSYNVQTPGFYLARPTKPRCLFAGWTGTGLSAPTLYVRIPQGSTGNRYYTATWQATYTVRHRRENLDGSYSQETSTTETKFGLSGTQTQAGPLRIDNYTPLPIMQQTISADASTVVDVYYVRNTYTLTFDASGGQGGTTASGVKWGTQTQDITAPTVTRTGYVFSGWSGPTTMPTNDTVLAARWTPIGYTMTYDLSGGRGSDNPPCYTIESDNITLSAPSKEGYDFAGWTGTGLSAPTLDVTIPKGSTGNREYSFFLNLTDQNESQITLYAQWLPIHEFGILDAMYSVVGQVFGYDNGTDTLHDAVYDASTSEGPALDLDYLGFSPRESGYFRVRRTGDGGDPIALYMYDPDGRPYVPQILKDPWGVAYSLAPEGSLIGSGDNDGLTPACKQSLESLYGGNWAKGLVTVGNITKFGRIRDATFDHIGDGYAHGFVFTSVNGVSYFICGMASYGYGAEHVTEYMGYDVTEINPTPEAIDAVQYYDSGPKTPGG